MKNYRFLSAAIFGFALTFTISYSGGNNEDVSSSSSYLSSSSVEASSSSSVAEVSSSSSVEASSSSSVVEVSSSSSVKAVEINGQVWMAENLNYAIEGSKCVDGDTLTDANTAYCDKYGRLYNLEAAKKACPSGWHLPSYDEWETLIKFVRASGYLKAENDWGHYGGEDKYEFAALPGGYYDGYYFSGDSGYWWSSSENHVIRIPGGPNDGFYWETLDDKNDFCSVRCVQD
jgi:uncharacterized protein (TIGR02145 family)